MQVRVWVPLMLKVIVVTDVTRWVMQVRVWVPLDLMQRMQERVVDRSGPQHAGLLVSVLSDFQEVSTGPV
jgi:hypothetical protein